MCKNLVFVLQFDTKNGIGESFYHASFELYGFFFTQWVSVKRVKRD